ncbi:hypothetical protein ACIPW5_04675 [Streptomyces sp. NPDC090077]|uniref:hypothetical protein n=1 Tax=Streptomyces sp. NPDC090077 TaxID=3365938 RepID=UPI003802CA4B
MTAYDAQTALDAIRNGRQQALAEYLRHAYSRPYLVVAALGLFAVFASFDLPNPLNVAAVLAGNALAMGGSYVHQRRATVRRRTTGREVLGYAVASVVTLVFFWAVAIAAYFAGLPARHTVAAAVTALAVVAASYAFRPAFVAMLRREGEG